MKKVIILGLVVILFLVVVGCTPMQTQNTKNLEIQSDNSKIKIELNSIEIKDALERSEYGDVIYPSKNSYFVILDITITNVGYRYEYGETEEEKSKLYLYYTEFQLYDKESYSHKPDTVLSIGLDNMLSANINVPKNDKLRGKLIYEIPKISVIKELVLKGGDTSGRTDVGTIKLDILSSYKNALQNFVSDANEIEKEKEQKAILDKSEEEKNKDKVFTASIGESKDDGELELTVNGVEFLDEIGTFKAPAGKQIVVVDLTVKNIYQDNKKFFIAYTYLTDESGYNYKNEWDVDYRLDNRFSSDEILPGTKSRGKIGFIIPIDTKNVKFVTKFEILDGDTLIVDLDK